MKIIIAGAGEVGTYLAKMLSEGQNDIIVIDTNSEKLDSIGQHFDVLTVEGNCTSIEILNSADIERTDLFIAITELEEANILAASLAKRLGAKKTVARINNREYIQPVNRQYFTAMGIDSIIYPEILAAAEIVNLLQQSGTTEVGEFAGGKLSLFVVKLSADAPLVNKTLDEAAQEYEGYLYRAVAITRNSRTIIPTGNDMFLSGDMVYVITNRSGAEVLMASTGKKPVPIKNVMILGGSRVGSKTARMLQKEMNIKLLEINKDKSFKLADELENTLVVNADGRDFNTLKEEGLEKMDAFIAVTGNSETNILSCLIAKRLGVPRTIAEIENMEYVALAENIGVDTIINKKSMAAGRIFSLTMNADVKAVQCLMGTDAEVLEFVVHQGSRITKAPLKNLKFPQGAVIGGVVRGEDCFIADGSCRFTPNDKVVIFALPESINKITEFFA